MEPDTRDTIIWLFCIVVLAALCFRVYDVGTSTSCDQCTITLLDKLVVEESYSAKGIYNVRELYEAYINEDKCLLYWDSVQGYGGGLE